MNARSSAGYSGTPLPRKIGFKEGMKFSAVNPPPHYKELLGRLPEGVEEVGPRGMNLDLLHVFAKRASELRRGMPGWRKRIASSGMIWVSWPKKSSGIESDITEDVVREVAFANKLVDVKVCAVDETWSGLKLVIRVKDRGKKG